MAKLRYTPNHASSRPQNTVQRPQSNKKTTLFLLCSYFRAHPTTLLLKILGGGCMGHPPPQILGGTVPPVPPRSLPLHDLGDTIPRRFILLFTNYFCFEKSPLFHLILL